MNSATRKMITASSVAENKASFRRIPELIYNTGDVAAADDVMLADYVEHIPLPPGYPANREGFVRFVEMWRTAVPDLEYTVTPFTADALIGEDAKVMHRVIGRGTHLGEMMGIPASGRPLEWTEMHIGRYEDGMLVEHWGQIDVLRIMQCIGVVPGLVPAPPEAEPPAVEEAQTLAAAELRDQGRRIVEEIWNEGHLEIAEKVVRPDAVHVGAAVLPAGAAGMKGEAAMFRNAFPDLHVELEDMIVEAPYVVTRLAATGTHDGELMGMPPTGKTVAFGKIEVLRFSGAHVTARWTVVDSMGLLGQLR